MGYATRVRLVAGALITVVAITMGASCSSSRPQLRIGAGSSPQSEILAEVYAGALARAGAPTVVVHRLGQRSDYVAALDSGAVAVVGDDSGDLLAAFDDSSPARVPDRPGQDGLSETGRGAGSVAAGLPAVADALSRALPAGLGVSDIADGTDLRPQFVLSEAVASRFPHGLSALSPDCSSLKVGIAAGNQLDPLRPARDARRDVVAPLRAVYGCEITEFTELPDDSALQTALRQGRVQAGVLTAPAALLPGGGGGLVPVADPAYAFRAQNALPLYRLGRLSGTELRKLNYVAGELTTADLAAMVRQVRDEKVVAASVAQEWLDKHL